MSTRPAFSRLQNFRVHVTGNFVTFGASLALREAATDAAP